MARAELDRATFPPSQLQSRRISELYGFDGTVWRRVTVNAAGDLSVSGVIADVSPGTTITTGANTALGIGATSALPVAPANTRRVRVQATGGDTTTQVLIREVGAAAGTGILLDNNGSTMYGGADGAVASLEAQNLAGPAVTVRIQFERD